MPLYLQVGHQDQKPSCSNKMIDKTKGDGAKKPSLPSTDLFASIGGMSREQMPPFHPRSAQCNTDNLPPLKMTKVQDKYISDTMAELREKHVNDRAAKRQKRLAWDNQDDATSIDCGSGNQSLLDKLDASPDFAQVVASPGGLITYSKFILFTFAATFTTSLCSLLFIQASPPNQSILSLLFVNTHNHIQEINLSVSSPSNRHLSARSLLLYSSSSIQITCPNFLEC